MKVFKKAIENVKPARRGQVPPRRRLDLPGAGRGAAERAQLALAMRWLIEYARRRAARRRCASSSPASCSTPPRTAAAPIKKKEDTHRMAEANKAFAHYRW